MALRWLLCAGLHTLLVLAAGHLTQSEEKEIENLHNMYRAMVEPPAADMLHMSWAEELMVVAEQYAVKCIWNHNPEVKNIMGENLFITTGKLDVKKGLSDWFEERDYYVYDNDTCPEDQMCGHYTQMVWAKTTRVGCASHFCDTVEGLHFEKATILVCNYLPPGNVIGDKPYEAGPWCSKCPEEQNECVNSSCSSTERSEFPSVEPTEMFVTDFPDLTEAVGSRSERSSTASLLLTGLVASVLLM